MANYNPILEAVHAKMNVMINNGIVAESDKSNDNRWLSL